jgi:iron complex outermembrane recepter protein
MSENKTRKSLLAAAIAGILSGGAQIASAQEAADPGLEEITVTGSRIARTSGFTTPVPITTVTTDELFNMEPGNTVSEQLDGLPQFFANRTPQNAGPGGGSSIVGSASAGLNLRNLGANRTLVLLDGSRVVPTDKQGTVNVDVFPTALMRTVDVVTGGASAAYGADAVGGVVNFVLDREFEGLDMRAGFGQHETGAGNSEQFEISAGTGLFNDRLHLIGSFQSQEVDEVAADWQRLSNYQFWGHVRNPAWAAWRAANPTAPASSAPVPLRITRPWVSSSTSSPTGLITGTGPATGLDNMRFTEDGKSLVPFVFGEGGCQGGTGCQSSMAGGPEAELRKRAFTREAGATGNGAVVRSGLFGAQYDMSDRLSVHWQGMVGRTESIRDKNMRFYPIMNAGWTPIIFTENAYLPASIRQVLVANNLSSFQLRKQGSLTPWHDIASQENSRDVFTNWNWKMGLDYTIPGLEWDLALSYQQGESKRNSQMNEMLRHDRLHLAMDAVVNPANGQIVCRVKLFNPTREQLAASVAGQISSRAVSPYIPAGTPGNTQPLQSPIGLDNTIEECVPINIFGAGNMTREALDYIGTWNASRGNVDQDFAEALMTGQLYEGWGPGSVDFAVGLTWRDQQFIEGGVPVDIDIWGPPKNAPAIGIRGFPPSVNSGTGSLHALAQTPYIGGQTDVWEWFSEINVPVFDSEVLFGQNQTVNTTLAYRASTYDRSGRFDSWKVGVDFQLIDDLRFRLTRSHDVREPTFFELFDAQANAATASDPRFGGETYTFSQVQGGNPNLRPEEANTTVVGMVWQPTFVAWLNGLQLSLDWYRVKIDDSIALLTIQQIVDECEKGAQPLCGLIERDAGNGRLVKIFNTYQNVAQAATEGVDLEIAYQSEPDFFESTAETFNIRWLSGYVKERSNTPFGSLPIRTEGSLGSPDFTSVITASYGIGPWNLQLQGRFVDAMLRNAAWIEGIDVDDNTVSAMAWWNTRLGYNGELSNGSRYNVSLNVQNIFDREPPVVASFSDFSGGSQSVSNVYDVYGRRYNLNFSYSF